jgi:hypothetical protein
VSKAGHLFVCVLCGEDHPEDEATHDYQLGGPVCVMCRVHLQDAVQVLAKAAGITRPLLATDINQFNHKRFTTKHL